MIYLERFEFNDREPNVQMTCFNTVYPFGILTKHDIRELLFDHITIFYGGNGSGKTTALNIIAEKLLLKRDTLYNKSAFFEEFLEGCSYEAKRIPFNSRIITSDDVFDYTMNLRHLNEGIDRKRLDLLDDYRDKCSSNKKLESIEEYEKFREIYIAKKSSISQHVKRNLMSNVPERSNGESGFMYFTSKIQENSLYLLDEPENSLSPERQKDLLEFIQDTSRFYKCQFIIATHSPFLLSIKEARIYDFDSDPTVVKKWTELKNVQEYYNFFKSHENEFEQQIEGIK